jgi:hypothetical protein
MTVAIAAAVIVEHMFGPLSVSVSVSKRRVL